jgi:hypothetical protein
MTCQYPYLSFGTHRVEPQHGDLRHSAVARIQKAVLARLEENVHGRMREYIVAEAGTSPPPPSPQLTLPDAQPESAYHVFCFSTV